MADLNIDSETGESVIQGRSPRFSLWVAFWVFSTVTLGSSVEIVSARTHVMDGWMIVLYPHHQDERALVCVCLYE